MSEPANYFDQRQSSVLKWLLVGLTVVTALAFAATFMVVLVVGFSQLRTEIMKHLMAIMTVVGMGVWAFLLIVAFRHAEGPIEFEAATIKFKGGSGPVLLWIMTFLSIAAAAKMFW
ncbi:MAG: hypothetical protein ABSC22_09155 [Roseiarcus sp.]|jgi:hypothetical protein